MTSLTMTVSRLYSKSTALSLKEGFERDALEEGDSFVALHQVGILRRWQLIYSIAQDVISKELCSWLLMHMDFLASATFETSTIGWTGLTKGRNFTMTMRK